MGQSTLRQRQNHRIGRYLGISLLFFLIFHRDYVLCESTYFYSRYMANWDDARLECAHIGGFLVQLDNEAELILITRVRGRMLLSDDNPARRLWIGLKDDGSNRNFRWLDGTPVDPSLWTSGDPNELSHLCGFIIFDRRIADGDCDAHLNFVCEVEEGSELAQSRADLRSCYVANDLIRPVRITETYEVPKCPRNKVYFSPSHLNNFMTWTEADAFCKVGNGKLAKIKSLEEQLMVDRFGKVKGFGTYWIGGTVSGADRKYTWEDGQLISGDGGWPDFLLNAEPASDPNKNCIAAATTGNRLWEILDCNLKFPVLCEMDADSVPNHQSCYWTLAHTYWTNHKQQCLNGGGNLANIKTINHFERMTKLVVSSHFNIGMNDEDQTWTWTWTDGSLVTWARWYRNTEPNSPSHHFGQYWFSLMGYNDAGPITSNQGLCEKTVFQFENADILHADGSITVTCREPCTFNDGTITKTWTCAAIDVTSAEDGCRCGDGLWTILEPWLSHLNTSALQDNDNDTCITVGDTIHVLTLSYGLSLHGSFETEVVLSPDIDHLRRDIISVFTSTDLSYPEATCQLSGYLSKCKHGSGSKFACTCGSTCNVYVKLFQVQEMMLPLTVCAVGVE